MVTPNRSLEDAAARRDTLVRRQRIVDACLATTREVEYLSARLHDDIRKLDQVIEWWEETSFPGCQEDAA